MKKALYVFLVIAIMVWSGRLAFAHCCPQHDGPAYTLGTLYAAEHGGKEHGGSAIHKAPTADDIRRAMKQYVLDKSAETGSFDIYDSKKGKTRRLALIRVHERVGKTGDYYYSCSDFKDLDSAELVDLDLDVEDSDGALSVVDVRIHKVNGKARYTYDANDNRIPVSE